MAKYKHGINGPFSGKIGPVTGASWKGRPYIKSNNSLPRQAPSEKQLSQRMVFGFVSSWLRPMKDCIEIGYAAVQGKTPMNAAISFVMKNAVTTAGSGLTEGCSGAAVIDYPQMVWSRGELLASVVTKFEVMDTIADDGSMAPILRIEWLNAAPSYYNQPDDGAVFILYSAAKAEFAVFEGNAVRSDGMASLHMPWILEGDTIHGWMFYKREDGQVSTNVYCGAVTVSINTK